MILSCCVIVKDDSELDNLKRCVTSVVDYVDEVIVTANGKEVTGIENFCKNNPKIVYTYHKWTKDFAEQRNFNFSKARKDADYIIWIDSDDVLVGGELLRDIAEKAKKQNLDAVFFDYWYACMFKGEHTYENIEKVELTQMRERLLKPGVTVWRKRLHETPVPLENIDYKHTEVRHSNEIPIVWLHLGVTRDTTIEDQKSRQMRNKELLELQLEDEKKAGTADPRTLLYLMKIYGEMNDDIYLTKTLEMGNEYLIKSGWDAERATCCAIMGRSLQKLDRIQESKDFLFKSIREYPYDPILYLYLSRVCFNLGQYREMKHWLQMALDIDNQESAATYTNVREMKSLSMDLMVKYYWNAEKNARKAYKSMKLLYKEEPSKENKETLEYLEELNDLDVASEDAHKLMLFYEKLGNSPGVVKVVESMPKKMQDLQFAWYMYNRHKEPRIWKENEICYYATFGSKHFEQWGPENLKKGLGGSETAVIRLAEEWAKKGYKVVVYCDCGKQEGMTNGVLYLPYFKFNMRDSFNIFINWRSAHLAGKIKAKKFIVDLHDLYNQDSVKDYNKYDKLFVKSEYHRGLAPNVPEGKVKVVSNGI
jgi:glycosyltransferase involved in cell wall biosynthesis